MRRNLINLALVVAIVTLVAVSLLLGSGRGSGDEPFAGTDAAATAMVEESGYQPWFSPIFEPGSGEIESGLFAAQAALGAGVLGYCLGRLRDRRRIRELESRLSAGNPEPR